MKNNRQNSIKAVLLSVIFQKKWLTAAIFLTVVGAVVTALLPPLVLESTVDRLTQGLSVPFTFALLYFGLTALSCLFDSARESLLIVFGQKITHSLRRHLCAKLSRMPADAFVKQEPGVTVSRFVGDVDTVESLFTSGIISMFADCCKVVSIFAVIFVKNLGLALLLLALTPLLFWFTRVVQKRMLKAQLENRTAVAKVSNHVPETIRCIRMIHTLHKEDYMRQTYDRHIQESYAAVEKTNFYDAIYSPVILILNALVIGFVMALSASGDPNIQGFFGMSVGASVAVIAYISKVFAPLESIGMEIQTIQSSVAGVCRINEFLSGPERWNTEDANLEDLAEDVPSIELQNVTFGYDSQTPVLEDLSFSVQPGEQVTLSGRTGAGKSTAFKLLLGLYRPDEGRVLVCGKDAALLPDSVKRRLFGYVEQSFRPVPGTVLDQITLLDPSISRQQAEDAAKMVGLHHAITNLEQGYDMAYAPALFSQGQRQLLSIARAVAAQPKILLLDEITANLDSDTEQAVLSALTAAAENRTVLSISHRLYEKNGGRQIQLEPVRQTL